MCTAVALTLLVNKRGEGRGKGQRGEGLEQGSLGEGKGRRKGG